MHIVNTQSFGLWVLGIVLLIAMWKDVTQRRIPNALLVVATGLALPWSMTARILSTYSLRKCAA